MYSWQSKMTAIIVVTTIKMIEIIMKNNSNYYNYIVILGTNHINM